MLHKQFVLNNISFHYQLLLKNVTQINYALSTLFATSRQFILLCFFFGGNDSSHIENVNLSAF